MYRSIDELGRIVLPIEIRKAMNIISGDLLHLELVSNSDSSLVLIISKEALFNLCPYCGDYCKVQDNFCSSCGLDFNKSETEKY